jgi:hypothetical protein
MKKKVYLKIIKGNSCQKCHYGNINCNEIPCDREHVYARVPGSTIGAREERKFVKKTIWDWCEEQINYIENLPDYDCDDNYSIGLKIAYQNIQRYINGKCTK